jgi:predicted nucleotidyltransferase
MHFYESSIITTIDGLQCQVYGNEHPPDGLLIKPKYIPTERVESHTLPYRFIAGRKMNRLNLWADKAGLKTYIHDFKEAYPHYVFNSEVHEGRQFFIAPVSKIERRYTPRKGLSELMQMPEKDLDPHLKTVYDFINFVIQSRLTIQDLGITYSTLMGHYYAKASDINVVVYGKDNFWKLMKFLKTASHPSLRWKSKADWLKFYQGRNRFKIFSEKEFLDNMQRKCSEGYFNGTLFVIFAAEKEEEVWFKWGWERYTDLGNATVKGIVTNNTSSVVRPGCYDITDSKIIAGEHQVPVKKVVFYSRDYGMIAEPGETILTTGVLEKVEPRTGEPYHRIVTGYFDSFTSDRREKEFVKMIK